jgi:hypothetical protein
LLTSPGLADVERRNLIEIERLNQRGGRTLSVVDLVESGTLSVEMAALCRAMVLGGASWLTGAVPGGAGKTTVMAALLGFLPPGEPIVTVARPDVIRQAASGGVPAPAAMLAHEMGAGHWFGYVWGRDAADFLRLTRRGLRCVSCLHADDPDQTRSALRTLGVTPEDLGGITLEMYIHISGGGRGRPLRRVSSLHCRLGGRLQTAFRWREHSDDFERAIPRDELAALLAAERGAEPQAIEALWHAGELGIERLRDAGVHRFDDVRREFVAGMQRRAPRAGQ